MSVDYTARNTEVTPKLRRVIESGLNRINKLLGGKYDAKVVFSVEKHQHKVGITVSASGRNLSGIGRGTELNAAVTEALEHISTQAARQKERAATATRRAAKPAWKNGEAAAEPPAEAPTPAARPRTSKAVVPMVVHKFPDKSRDTETHLVHLTDRVALRPMSIEEAVKEAEFRDYDVFVFRDPKGHVMVLHRRKDGKVELIEAP